MINPRPPFGGAGTSSGPDDQIAGALYKFGLTPYNPLSDVYKLSFPHYGYIRIGNQVYTYDASKTSVAAIQAVLGPLRQGEVDYESLSPRRNPATVLGHGMYDSQKTPIRINTEEKDAQSEKLRQLGLQQLYYQAFGTPQE